MHYTPSTRASSAPVQHGSGTQSLIRYDEHAKHCERGRSFTIQPLPPSHLKHMHAVFVSAPNCASVSCHLRTSSPIHIRARTSSPSLQRVPPPSSSPSRLRRSSMLCVTASLSSNVPPDTHTGARAHSQSLNAHRPSPAATNLHTPKTSITHSLTHSRAEKEIHTYIYI